MTTENEYRTPEKPDRCEICQRLRIALTRHHLIPRARHRKKRNRRLFRREDVITRILWVCRPCHNHIHDVLTEKELEADYNTRETLLTHPDIHRFREWISRRPADFKPASRSRRRT